MDLYTMARVCDAAVDDDAAPEHPQMIYVKALGLNTIWKFLAIIVEAEHRGVGELITAADTTEPENAHGLGVRYWSASGSTTLAQAPGAG